MSGVKFKRQYVIIGFKTGARWITRSDIWKEKAFLRRLGAAASGAVRKPVTVLEVASFQEAACHLQWSEHTMEGSQFHLSWLCTVSPTCTVCMHCHRWIFLQRPQWSGGRKERSEGQCLYWKPLVTDGSSCWMECGILERNIHIWTRKEDEMLPDKFTL